MGQAHSRSIARIPGLFAERSFDARLVVCADPSPRHQADAVESFGFETSTADWRQVVDHPDVDVVFICAPNMLHLEIIEAAAAAKLQIFCEKPVGGTPDQTAGAALAATEAGIITGVGYCYRHAPMVRYARRLIAEGALGDVTNYRGRFFSMYGSDPLGLLSWRFQLETGGYGVSSDLLSHSVDLATALIGPIERVVGTQATFIRERPLPSVGATHYDRGRRGDPTGPVTNEDYVGALCRFANGAQGNFEASRTMVGPESQMALEVYGTKGALSWNLERLNELQLFLDDGTDHTGYATVFGGERFPPHGNFAPGRANGIGYEDLIVIQDFEYLSSVAAGRAHQPGFNEALDWVGVQTGLINSWESGRWEPVVSLSPVVSPRPGANDEEA
jgi:predicted dehydrogenase